MNGGTLRCSLMMNGSLLPAQILFDYKKMDHGMELLFNLVPTPNGDTESHEAA